MVLEGAAHHSLPLERVFRCPHAANKYGELGCTLVYAQLCIFIVSLFCSVEFFFLLVNNRVPNIELGQQSPRTSLSPLSLH